MSHCQRSSAIEQGQPNCCLQVVKEKVNLLWKETAQALGSSQNYIVQSKKQYVVIDNHRLEHVSVPPKDHENWKSNSLEPRNTATCMWKGAAVAFLRAKNQFAKEDIEQATQLPTGEKKCLEATHITNAFTRDQEPEHCCPPGILGNV